MAMKKTIFDLTQDELENEFRQVGFEKYRAKQVIDWVNAGKISFDEMTNVPTKIKKFLNDNFIFPIMKMEKKLVSKQDDTKKYLFKLFDGNIIETVLMKYDYGYSICISSQVGCLMGCGFCASTLKSKERDLSSYEMAGQIYGVQKDENIRISNVVVMGSGEPFDNYEEIIKFIKIANNEKKLGIGQRHITISTCGIVQKIYEFADLNLQINLAISLHSADQVKRESIMPIAKRYDLNSLKKAVQYYIKKTNRKVAFEYSLIEGFNDEIEDAKKLVQYIKGTLSYVNLIPINPIDEKNHNRPNSLKIKKFAKYLEENGINVSIRKEMGADINGACGQLRINELKK